MTRRQIPTEAVRKGGLVVGVAEIRQGPRKRASVARCGTDAGYYRHRRHGEDACAACRAAHSKATQSYRDRRKAAGRPLAKAKNPTKTCPICGDVITARATYCRRDAALRRRRDSAPVDDNNLSWVLVNGIWRAAPRRTA